MIFFRHSPPDESCSLHQDVAAVGKPVPEHIPQPQVQTCIQPHTQQRVVDMSRHTIVVAANISQALRIGHQHYSTALILDRYYIKLETGLLVLSLISSTILK